MVVFDIESIVHSNQHQKPYIICAIVKRYGSLEKVEKTFTNQNENDINAETQFVEWLDKLNLEAS